MIRFPLIVIIWQCGKSMTGWGRCKKKVSPGALFLTSRRSAGIGVDLMMSSCRNIPVCIVACAVAVAVCHAESPLADENGLWQIWVNHTNAAPDHVAIAQACEAFCVKTPADPLSFVAKGLGAWHLLKADKTNEAARLLEPMAVLSSNALEKAGAEIARSWLTRIDREMVRVALKRVYLRDVEFPFSLDTIKNLKGVKQPPITDRWNQPWSYKPAELPTIKGSYRQRYALESSRLGSNSDLAQSLAVPYASRITIKPVRTMDSGGAVETVEFTLPTQKNALLMVGTEIDGVTFAFAGKSIIVLSDNDYWQVLQKPR